MPSPRRTTDRYWRLVRRALATPAGEWRELAHAQLALVAAQWIVWIRPVGRLVNQEGDRADGDASAPGAPGAHACGRACARAQQAAAQRAARAVDRAARYGVFRPQCLVRSLALVRLLDRRGVTGARIRVGVRREGDRLHAHAWVERHGRVLGDEPGHVAGFAPLLDVRPPEAGGGPRRAYPTADVGGRVT
jgi:hypothetical protein